MFVVINGRHMKEVRAQYEQEIRDNTATFESHANHVINLLLGIINPAKTRIYWRTNHPRQ